MNRLLGLLKKDFQLSRSTLLIPIWIVLGMFALSLIMNMIAVIKGDISLANLDLNFEKIKTMDEVVVGIGYAVNHLSVIVPGILGIIFSISLANTALNDESQKNCVIFYRAQPISVWWTSFSKYFVSVFGTLAVVLIISIFYYFSWSLVFAFKVRPIWFAGLIGMIQSYLGFSIAIILIASFAYFCSAVFKSKAFVKGLGIIIIITIVTSIFNALYGWNIPSLMSLIMKFFLHGAKSFKMLEQPFNNSLSVLNKIIEINWNNIFSYNSLLKIIISGLFFGLGTFIYKNKEIK